jgi:hypothetical protein
LISSVVLACFLGRGVSVGAGTGVRVGGTGVGVSIDGGGGSVGRGKGVAEWLGVALGCSVAVAPGAGGCGVVEGILATSRCAWITGAFGDSIAVRPNPKKKANIAIMTIRARDTGTTGNHFSGTRTRRSITT